MSGMFQSAASFAQKSANLVADVNPLNRVTARLDPGGNALGVYGTNAPHPIADHFGDAMGLYGQDTADYDKQTYENERVKALQQGETDMAAVNKRTGQMLAGEGLSKRSTGMTLLGG